jgi:hypothetical protein
MNTLQLFALTFSLVVSACSQKQEVVGTTEPGPAVGSTGSTAASSVQPGGAASGDSLVFSLQRTPCFGTCKAYTINVYRSGYATFEGRANVDKEGLHNTRIPLDQVQALVAEAEANGFFKLEDKYDGPVTDLPSSIIRVVAHGKDKKVVGRVGAPESFKAFVAKAEGVLYPLPWKPVPQTK